MSQSSLRGNVALRRVAAPKDRGPGDKVQLNLLAEASSACMAGYWSAISPGGEQSVDFLHTASVDGNGAVITGFSLSALWGHDYLPAGIPKPGALTRAFTALGGLALRRHVIRG